MSFRAMVTLADFQLASLLVYNATAQSLLTCLIRHTPSPTTSLGLMKQAAGEETNDQLLCMVGINAPGDSSALSNDETRRHLI